MHNARRAAEAFVDLYGYGSVHLGNTTAGILADYGIAAPSTTMDAIKRQRNVLAVALRSERNPAKRRALVAQLRRLDAVIAQSLRSAGGSPTGGRMQGRRLRRPPMPRRRKGRMMSQGQSASTVPTTSSSMTLVEADEPTMTLVDDADTASDEDLMLSGLYGPDADLGAFDAGAYGDAYGVPAVLLTASRMRRVQARLAKLRVQLAATRNGAKRKLLTTRIRMLERRVEKANAALTKRAARKPLSNRLQRVSDIVRPAAKPAYVPVTPSNAIVRPLRKPHRPLTPVSGSSAVQDNDIDMDAAEGTEEAVAASSLELVEEATTPWYRNPWVIGGGVLLAGAGAWALSQRKGQGRGKREAAA